MTGQNKNPNPNSEGDDWEPWQKYHSARRGGLTALGQISTNPFNFGWFVADVLSGSGCPRSEQELRYLTGIGINHVVTLSPEATPPACITNISNLKWTVIPIDDFDGATIDDFKVFFRLFTAGGGVENGAIHVHCRGGNGRTGTFLAAYLIRFRGLSADDSIAAVRAKRPYSIESEEQVECLRVLEEYLKPSSNKLKRLFSKLKQ